MKKFFMNGTNDQLVFGDTLELDFTHEGDGNTVKQHVSCKFVPEIADLLLESGVIEEREVEEEINTPENDPLDFVDETPCEALEALEEDFDVLESKVESLEQDIRWLKCMHKDYVTLTNKMLDTFKDFAFNLPDKEEKKNVQPRKK